MRDAFWTVAALRLAMSTRRDLLFENLALRHQLGVLARSDRRFRSWDRLLWLCVRRLWPRWREALVLVKPATVARWHREGFRRCWSRRSRRRPGRPCIDSQLRALIRPMAAENRLWGAPRIHGELLKLGITVSERTVSRYLPDRLTVPSQTWGTFLANHLGAAASASTATSSYAPSDDAVVDAFTDGRCAANQWALVDSPPAPQLTSLGWRVAIDHVHHSARTRLSSGRDPPKSWAVAVGTKAGERFLFVRRLPRSMNSLRPFRSPAPGSPSAVPGVSLCNQVVTVVVGPKRLRSGCEAHVCE